MGSQGAGGAVEFAGQGDCVERVTGALQACQDDGHFFAKGGRGGDLAVGAGGHHRVCFFEAEGMQVVHHLADDRREHLVAGFADHHRVRQIVDVFGGQSEVDHFFEVADTQGIEAVTQPVFDGFDVVVDAFVDGRYGCGFGRSKCRIEGTQRVDFGGFEVGDGHDGSRFAEHDEVLDLDADAVAHQGALGKITRQFGDVAVVAPVEGRKCRQCVCHTASFCFS